MVSFSGELMSSDFSKVTERLLDVGGAALPLGVAERLLDDDGGFLVEVLLLSG